MKIWELLNEDDGGAASGGEHKSKKRDKFPKASRDSIPGMTRYKDTAAHYYDMYRMGVHMAGSPDDHHDMADTGPTSNEFVTLAYTDEDQKIIKNSARAMGFKGVGVSSKGSKETDNTNKVSPVAKPKKNKYGV